MLKMNFLNRSIPLKFVALLMVLSVAGTALALTITSLAAEEISLAESAYAASDFTVTDFDTTIVDKNEVQIYFEVTNGDSVAHFANVTVALLGSSGDVIAGASQVQATGSVAASGAYSTTLTFAVTGVVAAYSSVFIVIDQSS